MHSYEDNAKFYFAFLATTLSPASRFRQKQGVIENFEYLGEFEEYFRKCWLYCVLYLLVIERSKKSLKTDYENLVHVYNKFSWVTAPRVAQSQSCCFSIY
jgi:hypothetical protein